MSFETAWRRNETQSFRGVLALGAVGVVFLAFVVMFLSFTYPQRADGAVAAVEVGHLSDYELLKPVYFANGDFYLVKVSENEAFSLVPRETLWWTPWGRDCGGVQSTHTGAQLIPSNPRAVFWRPEYSFFGQTGWFVGSCSGDVFDVDGSRVIGPARSLDRYPVIIKDGYISVLPQKDKIIKGSSR